MFDLQPILAMHISEGILPPAWAAGWFALAIPAILIGLHQIKKRAAAEPKYLSLVALVGAAIFVISCMPIPIPWLGTCSHPCGTGLGAVLIGPGPTIVAGSIALLIQALFLAHGGLTTLGANTVSMAIAGALAGWTIFRIARGIGASPIVAAALAGILSDWATYATTSLQLSLALHGSASVLSMLAAIALAFAPMQLPLGILEGLVSAGAYRFIMTRRPEFAPRGFDVIPAEEVA